MNPCSQYSLTTTIEISRQNHEDIIENGMHKVCDSLWCLFLFQGNYRLRERKDEYEKI